MTTTSKAGIGVAVLVIIVLIGAYAFRMHTLDHAQDADTQASLPTSPKDTSDGALVKDTAAIDAQMSGLDEDTEAADEGLSEAQQ